MWLNTEMVERMLTSMRAQRPGSDGFAEGFIRKGYVDGTWFGGDPQPEQHYLDQRDGIGFTLGKIQLIDIGKRNVAGMSRLAFSSDAI